MVGTLNWFVPDALVPALAWIDTALETFLGVSLVIGLWIRSRGNAKRPVATFLRRNDGCCPRNRSAF
jgi:hypothetical protein